MKHPPLWRTGKMTRVMRSLARRCRGLARRCDGNVAILFAVLIFPLTMSVAVAIEYARALAMRVDLAKAADAAALAVAQRAMQVDPTGASNWLARVTLPGAQTFGAHTRNMRGIKPPGLNFKASVMGDVASSTVSYKVDVASNFAGILGRSVYTISGVATATVGRPIYTDVHLVIDNSASMGIGATDDAIKINLDKLKCSFACHYNYDGNGVSNADLARKAGSVLRIDVVKQATLDALDRVSGMLAFGRVRVAVYTLSNSLTTVFPLSSDLRAARAAIRRVDLAAQGGQGGTNTTYSLNALANSLTAAGDGRSALQPRGFVVLMTDGVQNSTMEVDALALAQKDDPNFVENWPYDDSRRTIEALDPDGCLPIKAKGYKMVTLEAKYIIPPEYDERFRYIDSWLAPIIPARLQACATSADYAFSANTPDDFKAQIYKIFASALAKNLVLTQ